MGKWIGGIFTALVVLAMTSALGAWLKGPIDDWVSRDRLQAEVQLAPWYARPTGEVQTQREPSDPDNALDRALAEFRDVAADISDYGIARVTVSNESSNHVTNVNFRLLAPLSAQDALVIDTDGQTQSLRDVNRVMLPDMKPGDRVLIYLWGNYSSYIFPERFRTYSSSGRFRVRYDWPTAQERAYESGIGRFLDKYAETVIWGCLGIITLLAATMAVFHNGYSKLLLKDEVHYHSERARYLANPDKFEPKISRDTVSSNPTDQQTTSTP